MKELFKSKVRFRVLALSATPGNDLKVKHVLVLVHSNYPHLVLTHCLEINTFMVHVSIHVTHFDTITCKICDKLPANYQCIAHKATTELNPTHNLSLHFVLLHTRMKQDFQYKLRTLY